MSSSTVFEIFLPLQQKHLRKTASTILPIVVRIPSDHPTIFKTTIEPSDTADITSLTVEAGVFFKAATEADTAATANINLSTSLNHGAISKMRTQHGNVMMQLMMAPFVSIFMTTVKIVDVAQNELNFKTMPPEATRELLSA
eukprot:946553_1